MAINNFNVGIGTTSQLTRYRYVATGGETSISGADADGKTLSYTVGLEQVYLNGANLVRGQDYTATNGTSVGNLTALTAGDSFEVFAFVPFNIANAVTASTVDAKGDLLVGTGADTVGRLAVGTTNDQQLVVDSSTASGLKWGSPSGLVHINTTSFTGVTSVSLAQGTFTSTYRNYRIILNFLPVTNLSILNVRFRKTGTDNTTSNYFYSGISTVHNSGTITVNNGNGVTAISTPANMSNNANNLVVLDLTDLQNSLNPKFNMQLTHSGVGHQTSGGYLAVSDAFDSLTFYMNTGNFSGRYQVFGVKE